MKFYFSIIILILLFCGCNPKGIASKENIAIIDFNTFGCFGGSSEIITIFKKSDELFAEFNSSKESKILIKLSNEKLKILDDFVQRLLTIKGEGYCTTIDNYKVNYQNKIITKRDGTCNWHGFDKLKLQLLQKS